MSILSLFLTQHHRAQALFVQSLVFGTQIMKTVVLDNIKHKDLKVKQQHSALYGENVNCVMTFPTEFADVHMEYPILFKKNASGEFQSVAFLGFEKEENLFLESEQWTASYVPAIIAKGPFLIGFQEALVDGVVTRNPVIHVNLEDPRLSEEEGEPVFLPHGGNSPYLENVMAILRGINDGMTMSRQMFAMFESFELIESVNIEIEVNEMQKFIIKDYFTISGSRLAGLEGEKLEVLNRAGFLGAAFLVQSSLHNVKKLISRKNRKRLREFESRS